MLRRLLPCLLLLVPLAVRAEAGTLELTGTLGLTGSHPNVAVTFTAVPEQGSTTWRLTGFYTRELRSLPGAMVRIVGAAPDDRQQILPPLRVIEYELLDTGGGKPFVGWLALEGERMKLTVRDFPRPLDVAAGGKVREGLARLAGCKLWMTGETRPDGSIVPGRFGLIWKPPAASPPAGQTTDPTTGGEEGP